ncbi:MAG: HD domain-containing protein [Spirochaetales bacterium]|uniref:HD domain-containing protein n=1 Tax=Candidatus Thalassospirochaeta sargassi TaxID=3119039 RepID=A0AAJ1IDZ6_9SPIO|nr:HD domain-containing protein [Spirochaetales bacterium]
MKELTNFDRPYSSRIIDAYVKLLQKRYPSVDLSDIYSYAGMKEYEIVDQAHWFNQEQVDLFYERAVQLTGNKKLAREAGQFFAHFHEGNLLRKYLLSLIGPIGGFEQVEYVSRSFTNYTEYKVKKITRNCVEVSVHLKGDVEEKPYQCENRIGMLEALPMLFNHKLPKIEHPECRFKGGETCRYIISWEDSRAVKARRIESMVIPIVAVGNIIAAVTNPDLTLSYILPTSIFGSLLFYALVKRRQVKELSEKVKSALSTTDELIHQIDLNHNNTKISQELGQAVNEKLSVDEILDEAISITEKGLEFDRGLILLANKGKTALEFRTGYGYHAGYQELLATTAFNLNNPLSKGVFVVCFKERRPFLINNVEDIKKDLSLRSIAFTKSLGSKSFICCPIICDNEAIGIISVDNLHSQRPLIQSDISQLMAIASVIGVGIKKVQLLQARESQFQSIIKVLASSIDARDPLTAGHSEKVAVYSDEIAKRMGFAKKERDVIRIASLLHDYGKIGVPDHILKKNGQLTVDEFEIIKTHAGKTTSILNQINFEDDYCEIPNIAGAHHERLDGRGYPNGLAGPEIPLESRIIAAADFYDAITSQRHYRNPMPFDEAVSILKAESGSHLDPKVVKVFCEYLADTQAKIEKTAGAVSLS